MRLASRLTAVFLATAVLAAGLVTPAFAGDSATVTGQVDTQMVSVTIIDSSNLDYGTVTFYDHAQAGGVEVYNSGTLASDWSLRGHDAYGPGTWALVDTPGVDQYAIDINDWSDGFVFRLATFGQTWETNVGPGASHFFNPILRMPTSSSTNGVYTFEIDVLATQSN
jgi:hypothetical protein